MGKVLAFVNTQQPVVDTKTGAGTVPYLNWFRDACQAINDALTSLESHAASIAALETEVDGLEGGATVPGTKGVSVFPLGGGDVALVDNPSLVWMTVKNPVRVRLDWSEWIDQDVVARFQVHSYANNVPATPRIVAMSDDGTVTRVLGTGSAATSTGTYTTGWSPVQSVSLVHGSGVEYCVLQVYTSQASQPVSATGVIECGRAVSSASSSGSSSESSSPSASVSPSSSQSSSPSSSASSSPSAT